MCGCIQSDNELGVDGAKALVPALSEMKMLQSLDLGSECKRCVWRMSDCFCQKQGEFVYLFENVNMVYVCMCIVWLWDERCEWI